MDATRVQNEIFTLIKAALPLHTSLADAIAETLDLSSDSAYRRIRGEKQISIDELAKLAHRFKFSIDHYLGLEPDSYVFTGTLIKPDNKAFGTWLETASEHYSFMAKRPSAHLYYMAKDLPLVHFFQTPELAAFKILFWQKTILQIPEFKGMKYKQSFVTEDSKALMSKIVTEYNKFDSSEIWSADSISSLLRQIEYYHEAGLFENKSDALFICDSSEKMIYHIERQAEEGMKFTYGGSPVMGNGKYLLFNNELISGNNNVLADLGDVKIFYLNHSLVNYVSTRDKTFNEYQLQSTLNLISKSEPLHTFNEKGRNVFFNKIRSEIDATRKKITRDFN